MGFEIKMKNGKKALFKDDKQITEWFDNIWAYELLESRSSYFLAIRNNKINIYQYENGRVNKITNDFDQIWFPLLGYTNYSNFIYFRAEKQYKQAIYQYKDGKLIKITNDFDWISSDGLVRLQSNFFKARDINGGSKSIDNY